MIQLQPQEKENQIKTQTEHQINMVKGIAKRRVGITKKKEKKKIIAPATLFKYVKSKNNEIKYSKDFMNHLHILVNYVSDELLKESIQHAEIYKTKTLMPNSLQYACYMMFNDESYLKTACLQSISDVEHGRIDEIKKRRKKTSNNNNDKREEGESEESE